MNTVIKYVFYLILIAVLYVIISAIYNGNMNSSTSVGEVGAQIKTGVENMVADTVKAAEDSVDK